MIRESFKKIRRQTETERKSERKRESGVEGRVAFATKKVDAYEELQEDELPAFETLPERVI